MKIKVRVSNNFGNQAVYPDCEVSRKLATLIGTKTFTERAIEQLEDLGYKFEVSTPTL